MSSQILTPSALSTPSTQYTQSAHDHMVVSNQPITLPLSMPSGKPYWYTVSEKMAKDSSQLCVSPFSSAFAIAQEAYYSSALDGAVGFTNHAQKALQFALQRLQMPVCAELVNDIAYLFTGIVAPYRTTTTPGTPQPATIPWYLEQLYRFLDDERYHPLIKAAMSHAYILAVQPVSPDAGGGHGANGRLARLISMTVLLRSGYSFLLNSSHSAVIVERNQDYAQSFRNIFLLDSTYRQAGNVTGFVEFIIETLLTAQHRALQDKTESVVKDSVSEMAQPGGQTNSITATPSMKQSGSTAEPAKRPADEVAAIQAGSTVEPATNQTDEVAAIQSDRTAEPATDKIYASNIVTLPFEDRLTILDRSPTPLVRRTVAVIREMLRDQQFEFTRRSWCEKTGITSKQFNAVRFTLFRYRLVFIARKIGFRAVYSLTLNSDCVVDEKELDPSASQIEETDADMLLNRPEQIDGQSEVDLPVLREMEKSRYKSVRETAAFYRGLLNDNVTEITYKEWMKRSGQSSREFHKSYEILVKRHLIANANPDKRKSFLYRITPECTAFLPPDVFWSRIENLENSRSENVRRGAAIVREMIEEGLPGFTSQEWANRTGMLLIEFGSIRNRLVENQLITNENKGSPVQDAYYRFMLEGHPSSMSSWSTDERPAINCCADEEHQKQSFIRHLNELDFNKSEVVRRGALIIRAMISKGVMIFSSEDWMQWSNMSREEYCSCYSAMLSRGIIRRLPKGRGKQVDYAFNWPVAEVLPESQIPPVQTKSLKFTNYSSILYQLDEFIPIDRLPEKAIAAMSGPSYHTTEHDWATVNNLSPEEASRDLNVLCCMGIVTRRYFKKTAAFSYHFRKPDELLRMLQNGEIMSPTRSDNLSFWANVALMSRMNSHTTRKSAAVIHEMVDEGIVYFTYGSWTRRVKMSHNQFKGCMKVMMSQHVATLVESSGNHSLYRLNIAPPETPIDFCELIGIEKAISDAQIERIKEFSANAVSETDRCIASFLLAQIEKGICYFTKKDYVKAYPLSQTVRSQDLFRASCLGLVGRTYALGTTVYFLSPVIGDKAGRELPFSSDISKGGLCSTSKKRNRSNTLSTLQKKRLTVILHTFGYKDFTRTDYENTFHLRDGHYALDPLIVAGLIVKKKARKRNYYRLSVTPEERPECFDFSPSGLS